MISVAETEFIFESCWLPKRLVAAVISICKSEIKIDCNHTVFMLLQNFDIIRFYLILEN